MTLQEAIEKISMIAPVRSFDEIEFIWFENSHETYDASFEDWRAARATAVILNAVQAGELVVKP